MMLKVGMRDEIIPVRFRPNRVHGSLHFSRTGIITFIITALDSERFASERSKNPEIFTTIENELLGGNTSREKRY